MGRKVMTTTLDPIPRVLRACPGHIVLNRRELKALKDRDGDTFKELVDIVQAEDAGEARRVWK